MTKKERVSPVIVSITGTKGKTTVAKLLEYFYTKRGRDTLLVDTHGHYLNGEKRGTDRDSLNVYGLVPTVCPGRFLYELKDKKDAIAILETSVGSSALPGIGYRWHDIGIFTNVFEDHIGRRIKTKLELAKEKGRIFRRVINDGVLIFNADDEYVTHRIKRSKKFIKRKGVRLIPVGIKLSAFNMESHFEGGGEAFSIKDNSIVLLSRSRKEEIVNLSNASWTFMGRYKPAVLNLMMAIACIHADRKKGGLKEEVKELFENYRPEEDRDGRMLCYRSNRKNIGIIMDYAHEKESLKALAGLVREITGRKAIGVIRFAPDRTDEQIKDYSSKVVDLFEKTVIYDKIDGVNKMPLKDKRKVTYRDVGEVSDMVLNEMKNSSSKPDSVHRFVQERDAFKKAFEISESGDIIVHIFGQSSSESINIIKDIADANLCSPEEMIKRMKDTE